MIVDREVLILDFSTPSQQLKFCCHLTLQRLTQTIEKTVTQSIGEVQVQNDLKCFKVYGHFFRIFIADFQLLQKRI